MGPVQLQRNTIPCKFHGPKNILQIGMFWLVCSHFLSLILNTTVFEILSKAGRTSKSPKQMMHLLSLAKNEQSVQACSIFVCFVENPAAWTKILVVNQDFQTIQILVPREYYTGTGQSYKLWVDSATWHSQFQVNLTSRDSNFDAKLCLLTASIVKDYSVTLLRGWVGSHRNYCMMPHRFLCSVFSRVPLAVSFLHISRAEGQLL